MKKELALIVVLASFFLCSCGSGAPAEENMADAQAEGALMEKVSVTEAAAAQIQETAAQTTAAADAFSFDQDRRDVEDAFHYISFVQNATTYSDEENHQLFLETLTRPECYSSDQIISDWVNGILDDIYMSDVSYGQDLLKYAESSLKEVGEEQFYSYSHYVSMGIGRHDHDVISLLALSSVYSGGTHPNSVRTAYNLDLALQKVLTLEDVIFESGVPELVKMVQSDVESKFAGLGEDALFPEYVQTIATALEYGNMTPYWYFSEDGLVIFFNQYALGPYTSGMIRILMTYEELKEILKPEYFPDACNGSVSDIKLAQKPAEGEWVYYVDLAEGETIYISIEGAARHVQFSEVLFADRTPVGEAMLFSANQIDDSATIAITGDWSDTSKVYAVEYYDEHGGPYILYIQGKRVLEELPTD